MAGNSRVDQHRRRRHKETRTERPRLMWGAALSLVYLRALLAALSGILQGGILGRGRLFAGLSYRQVHDQLAKLRGVARALGTTAGHDRSMASRASSATAAEFQNASPGAAITRA